jgi:hypothetical protein
MKLPHDFQLGFSDTDERALPKAAITQNVIVDTAEHVTQWVCDFIDNNITLVETDYIRQDNTNGELIYVKSNPLF